MNGTCEGVAPHMRTVVESPGVSLFCFSVYTADTGSEKPSHELELLQMQHDNAWNVFSCTEWANLLRCRGSIGWKRHDDQSGGREKRFPLREAQGSENLDQHRHVRVGLDCGSRRGPCPQSQLDHQSRRRRSFLPTEIDRGVAGCTSACGGRLYGELQIRGLGIFRQFGSVLQAGIRYSGEQFGHLLLLFAVEGGRA